MSSRRIYKFSIDFGVTQEIAIPMGARIVHVGMQVDAVCVWVDGDTARNSHSRWLRVYGTGHPVHPRAEYVGTAMTPDGAFVWHVFEEMEMPA